MHLKEEDATTCSLLTASFLLTFSVSYAVHSLITLLFTHDPIQSTIIHLTPLLGIKINREKVHHSVCIQWLPKNKKNTERWCSIWISQWHKSDRPRWWLTTMMTAKIRESSLVHCQGRFRNSTETGFCARASQATYILAADASGAFPHFACHPFIDSGQYPFEFFSSSRAPAGITSR